MMPVSRTTKTIFAILLTAFTWTGLAQAQSPPTIAKSFSAATVGLNGSVTLTFTLTNPNPATDLTGVSFSDDMPAGLLIANPDSLGGTCDTSVVTLTPTNISLVGTVILANSSCTLSIDVLATAAGDQVNTTGAVTSVEGGTGGTATATVSVVVPDLTITKSHTGNFVRPQTGATYTITVSNIGGADTSALITVNDNLPAGLTATDFSGTNWNCTLSPLQCTRGDVLFAGTSFEPITLTVNVAANAPSSVTNTATVSGGAESNTANDSASDVTQIDAALLMAAQTANLTVAAGNTTSTTLNVNYNGSLGAVTFACSGLPAASTCSFNPPSVTAAGATPVTLTIATTVRSTAIPQPNSVPPQFTLLLGLVGLTALAFALLRSKNSKMRLATASAGLALLLLVGCGVSNNPPAPSPTPTPGPKGLGTPAGTSAVVVTATSSSGGGTATSTVNLTVQ
ncbi:MAG TPA: hypothetical protein VGJ30_08905 [Candidatus Angelobacter sp.]|jgi:uncharacterized repeat protein (TIGR01451 family)